jgi:7-carboxy-7-deazaguanine synthase (Cx14CxxC type)
MPYRVKELFYTLQGEGRNVGRAAVFCRFAGCNLWSGREADRRTAACQFCDTDFVGMDGPGGGVFDSPAALAAAVLNAWPTDRPRPFAVCTGGEPLLQLDQPLLRALHTAGVEVAIETNGTLPVPAGIDWVCVSPKPGARLVATRGDEVKLVFPQIDAPPERYEHLDFRYFYLQPMAGPHLAANTREAIAYCLAHPQWRLSVQMHKIVGIP